MRNKIVIILFSIIETVAFAQQQSGWSIIGTDSLFEETYYNRGKVRSTASYSNSQVKYDYNISEGQVTDTVKYFSKSGDLISEVNYKHMYCKLYDSAYLENYEFVQACLTVVQNQVEKSLENFILNNYVLLDGSNSRQNSAIFESHHINGSKLFDPVEYGVESCNILYYTRDLLTGNCRNLLEFRVDSGLRIVQSTINLRASYELNFDRKYADSIRLVNNFIPNIDWNEKRGIQILGPYLKFKSRKPYWVIERFEGDLVIERFEGVSEINTFDYLTYDDYKNELLIDVETGEVKRNKVFIGTVDCY